MSIGGALRDAQAHRGPRLGRQFLDRLDKPLQFGAKPVDLVDEAEKYRHVLLIEAQLVLEIADQRGTREIGLGIGRLRVGLRLDETFRNEYAEPRHREARDAGDNVLFGQHHTCSFNFRRGS
ncbi:MAG: hypothetical protein A49_06210 [Methyloceanibacter sp.]|nr:MAG: hypothetical protein A49_06210 [Methyloceanibacter sp.]